MTSRRTRFLFAILVFSGVLSVTTPLAVAADANAMSPAQLIAIDRALDGTPVTIEGEAIGESLRAGADHRWVNVLGGGVGVGVWLTNEQAETVGVYGDHVHTGDIVRVRGTVNVSCITHGGEFDVHADSIELLEPGFRRTHEPQLWKLPVGLVGLLLGLVEYRLWRVLRERRPG
ncbi:MAG: hypothetical protein Q8K99_13545 [Actinomycetota bacterium]|nr:hypothetical protein [Actinomycetota bacterium]